MTFWYGSGFADPYHWLFRIRILRLLTVAFKMPTEQKYFSSFYCLLRTVLFEVTFTLGFKDKDIKKSQDSRNQVFLFLIDDGRIKIRTNNDGSGSRRPKNLRIREAQKLSNPGGLKTYGSGSITLNKNSAFPEPVGWRPFSIGSIFKYRTVRTN